ncbi:MAG TPA: hypothetical protein VM409_06120 [Chloroflexia bacterium]|nr:hypothetical protein [Chloroflexia bacterium]
MERARRTRTILAVLGTLLALFPAISGGTVSAQTGEQQAGLVIQFAGGRTQTFCIPFTGDSITGLDLLLKTGLPVKIENYSGSGAFICKIGADGCDYPEQPCVCQSYGPGGVYWSYHHLKDGQWRTSGVGLSSYRLHNGDVDGLAWSAGKSPALTTFSQVCAAPETQQATATASQPLATQALPAPVATAPLPTFTPAAPQQEPTQAPTVKVPTPRPTLSRATPTRLPATETTRSSPTSRQAGTQATTATPRRQPATATIPSLPPTETPALPATTVETTPVVPSATPTIVPINTVTPALSPTATATTLPLGTEPVSSEATARNIALGVGSAALALLVGLGIWRGRRKRSSK